MGALGALGARSALGAAPARRRLCREDGSRERYEPQAKTQSFHCAKLYRTANHSSLISDLESAHRRIPESLILESPNRRIAECESLHRPKMAQRRQREAQRFGEAATQRLRGQRMS